MLPQFPVDVWYRIAGFSSPETLSTLSEVSKTVNKAVTHPALFKHQISLTHVHPAQAFRREAALHHPPTRIFSALKNITRIYYAKDTALLYDASNNSLIAFPIGHVFPLRHADHQIRLTAHVPMLDELVGFLSTSGRELCALDLSTGHVTCTPLLERTTVVPLCRRVALAGTQGEWLVQRTKHKLFVTDRHTGETKREYHLPDRADVILVKGEFSRAHNGTCVGFATTTPDKEDPVFKTVHVHGFDGINTTFTVPLEAAMQSVLRSEDTLTHVLNTRQVENLPKYLLASRGSKLWYLFFEMEHPILGGNGTFIMESKQVSLQRRAGVLASSSLCATLTLPDNQSAERIFMQRVDRYAEIVWMRRIRGFTFLLVIGREKDKLELVKLSSEKGPETEEVLKDWVLPRVTHVQVIADHYILATSRPQKLHLIHFDRFCDGAGGVYACPLVGLSTNGYFLEQFREGDDVSGEAKRRQSDNSGLVAVK